MTFEMTEQIRQYIEAKKKPSIRLLPDKDTCASSECTHTRFAGTAMIPEFFGWPSSPQGKALDFLAQINLAETAQFGAASGLPDHGLLSIFYDTDEQPWGFADDIGTWRVEWFPDVEALVPHAVPSNVYDKASTLHLTMKEEMTYPDFQDDAWDIELDDEECDAFSEWIHDEYGDETIHRIFGYPQYVQGHLMKPGERLLLQMDSWDSDGGWMWGDVGRLYFVIAEDALAARDFARTRLELQCY